MVCVKLVQLLFVLLFVIVSNEMKTMAVTNMNIGAIVDTDTREGKEVKTAMEIAIQTFNDIHKSTDYMISPHFVEPGAGNPLRADYAAEKLIKDDKVQVIISMKPWVETTLIADIGSQAKIPILSLTSGAVTPPSASVRWPFLVQMGNNGTQQVKYIADMVSYYRWRRVIVIYEDDIYGGDSGLFTLLSEALQRVGSEIEHRLIFPPYSSLKNPTRFVRDEMVKLLATQSRVFIVLRSSIPLANILFDEAKQFQFMSRDSAWIVTSSIADQLDSLKHSSLISSMDGVLGLKTYFQNTSNSFERFRISFRKKFNLNYPQEGNRDPGVSALRAYDGIQAITLAIGQTTPSTSLLQKVLSSNFEGMSGRIHFMDGKLSQLPSFRIVNVMAKIYKDLGFWAPEYGISQDLVHWPGNLATRSPKGWTMPTIEKPMIIGVPGRTQFENFVDVTWSKETNKLKYDGFCIELFYKILDIVQKSYTLPYEFHSFNGTYDELINHVSNKTYDAIIGDVTILANRSKYVEFTQPYAESGLALVVPAKEKEHSWTFMKPFSMATWIVTGALLMYTVLIVWLLEHHSNPEFGGPWQSQLGTALWFTFSSLFFSHRETVHNNLTRVVVIIWLFAVLVLTSSYTASLASMLTVQRLQPSVIDINFLLRTNATVGCDGDSFIRKYLVDVLQFDDKNVKNVDTPDKYPKAFKSGNISAAFLELPYEKVFMKQHCMKYTAKFPANRFGGLGFVFPKGSPMARDFSDAILTLSENGKLQELSDKWFSSPNGCSSNTTTQTDSLNVATFIGLYMISGITSTLCASIFLVQLFKEYRRHQQQNGGAVTPVDESVWNKTVKVLFQSFDKGGTKTLGRFYSATPIHDDWISPVFDYRGALVDSTPIHSSSFDRSPTAEIEIVAQDRSALVDSTPIHSSSFS